MLMFSLHKNKGLQDLVFLCFFVTLLLFIISPDSYTHDLYNRVDSAWFFMCGKAWMNGMIPYVDFSDSKGPLLWLIYGIGYLLSRYNYIGIFWISCLWYSLVYFYTYKVAYVFLKKRRPSLICSIFMTLSYFYPWYHYETRAEDFCLLFIILSLYEVVLFLYDGRKSQKDIKKELFLLGFCFGALLMIKFNIAAMQLSFIIYMLFVLIKEKRFSLICLYYFLLGFSFITLPFIIYFLAEGNFHAFIQEYFINTTHTIIDHEESLRTYLFEWSFVITRIPLNIVLLILFIGCWQMKYLNNDNRYFPLICFFLFLSITIRHSPNPYYFQTISVFAIFLIVLIVSKMAIMKMHLYIICSIIIVYCVIGNTVSYQDGIRSNYFFRDGKERKDFYNIAYIMSQVNTPKILNVFSYEYGYGITSNSLPAGKYWALQNGYSHEMWQEQVSIIYKKKADFLVFNSDKALKTIGIKTLNKLGYLECYKFGDNKEKSLFSNKKVKLPPPSLHISNHEVFLKKRPSF